ncbi:hypothetical protein B4U80_09447, partial [Leptotrombidium deliense]
IMLSENTISTILLTMMYWLMTTQPCLVSAINCYTCNSRNFTKTACHDPFHPANITYTEHCKTPKVAHIGEFPASFCVKLKGLNALTNEELVIRTCTTENMNNQCGIFKFEKETLTGCIVTCDTDGCNGGVTLLADCVKICIACFVFQCLIKRNSYYR